MFLYTHSLNNIVLTHQIFFIRILTDWQSVEFVTSKSMHNKSETWIDNLDEQVIKLKKSWEEGTERTTKYQLVGDNWDKNILPSYRYISCLISWLKITKQHRIVWFLLANKKHCTDACII